MKKLYSFILIAVISFSGFAQNSEIKKADRFFAQRAFMDATDAYENVNNKNQEVLQNLADSYFYTNQMQNASEVYKNLFLKHGEEVAAEYKFRYAHASMAVGNYKEADKYFSEFSGKTVDFEKFRKELDTTVSHVFTSNQVMNNAASADFGISFYGDDKVTFASTRNTARPLYPWNKKPTLDLYTATTDDEGQLNEIVLFPGDINTDSHESSATFSKDGMTMYFDRTNDKRVKVDDDKIAHVSLYRAKMVDGNWSNIEKLPFSSDSYSVEHPSLSADGKKLYFASDMPGTNGSFDIYMVDVNEDGSFGTPQNLGAGVNTAHREQFPFISEEGILYFSSDGHQGFGNLDIYKSEGDFSETKNLGATINSGFDDFAYVVKEGEDTGWFASNRRGTDNLYNFLREDYTPPVVEIEERETNTETGRQQLRDVGNIYFDFDKATIKKESEVTLDKVVAIMKKYPTLNIEVGSHADARGTDSYNMALSERRAAATLEYLVNHGVERDRLTSKGYGESMPLNDCTKPTGCTEAQYAKNRRSEFTIMN
ncbi:peptidoglycan-associated lipoprotein [Gillisia sp. Hel_I_86]|uniref:OmpA family protein n=1 Tax=Gillisia sp. Hel_I_86 TaxID=1249981 RepID=UPI0011990425|nr:OmpA family protein [Gillisia sp. Hel_I_86]TVZ26969.1 peptidoglycan-associated lipoprotein [Gillisia sp. Hel_I_86]